MATDLLKNERLQRGCKGQLFFNPYYTDTNIKIEKDGIERDDGYTYYHMMYDSDGYALNLPQITDGSIIDFGGQVIGFALFQTVDDADVTYITFPAGTFDYNTSVDISDMVNEYGNIRIYKQLFTAECNSPIGYSYYGAGNTAAVASIGNGFGETVGDFITRVNTDGGTVESIECISTLLDSLGVEDTIDNIISSVEITEVSVIKNAATYGHHSIPYNSKTTYRATLKLPYKTPIWKIQQLLQSEGVVFMHNKRWVYDDYELMESYNVQKPLGGGSINPVGHNITIVTDSLKETLRRNTYEIEVIIEG